METRTCLGCGVKLQYTDELKEGYILEKKYLEGALYCQRCFKLKNYSKKESNDLKVNIDSVIEKVNQSNGHAFFLVDLFNICDEYINTFKKIKINKTLIISKSDLIFNDINKEKVKNNIKDIYNISDEVIFLSSKKKYNINAIFKILKNEDKKNSYILGYTNAGKSTLINALKGVDLISSSYVPNTTLDFIKLNIDEYEIIDTPGFNISNTFYKEKEYEVMKKVNPINYVSPITYQSKDNQIFVLENRLYLKGFENNSITFYISSLVDIKKIYKEEKLHYKEINIDDDSDIVISTLGFINVKKKCVLKVNEDMFNLISVRKSIFK